MDAVSIFFLSLLHAFALQFLGLFGIFFLFGYLFTAIQHATHDVYQRTVGWKGVLLTAWIGTPVHELSHAIVAWIFRYKIHTVELFKPNKRTGSLGHVEYSFDRYRLLHRIGRFFVSAAPLICGSLILYVLLRVLLPHGTRFFSIIREATNNIQHFFDVIPSALSLLINDIRNNPVRGGIFLLLSFCISAHIAPSKQDRDGLWRGLFWIILILLIVNTLTLLFKHDLTNVILKAQHVFGIWYAIFLYVLFTSIIHYFLVLVLLQLPYKIFRR